MEARYHPTTGRLLMLANAEAKKEAAKAASMCEERLRFDPVPIYSVTLAEDMTLTVSDPYIISLTDIDGTYKCFAIESIAPGETSGNGSITALRYDFGDGIKVVSAIAMGGGYFSSFSDIDIRSGIAFTRYCSGAVSSVRQIQRSPIIYLCGERVLQNIEIGPSSGTFVASAGTTITVYAASLDQRITDVFGTELEEVTSEQIHSLFV